MEVIESVSEMRKVAESQRCQGRKIVFVPTMGYFHEGHINLMRVGRKKGDCLVVSIYVNPAQFSPTEDFAAYPRDFERDRALAEGNGVDVIFCPDNEQMYPDGYESYVELTEMTQNLCGISRPRFFRGVTTVCTKLFNIVKPHVVIFGRKDYQQYIIIKKMVRDLNIGIEVIGVHTTREADGLAMSSRNMYLKPEERKSAICLNRSLMLAKGLFDKGERDAAIILSEVKSLIMSHPNVKIDYAQICSTADMKDVSHIETEVVLAIAVWVGKTRLIDNHVFGNSFNAGEVGS